MRQIKFRAWMGNRMRSWEHLKIIGFQHLIYEQPKDISLMQFTGLTDKNGNEIYEGDIVHVSYGYGKVVYDKDHCSYFIEWLDDKEANLEHLAFLPRTGKLRTEIEVIGNIHENPHLL